jgi:hypothetical protein
MTGRSAILAPGGSNSVDVPVLMFARLAIQRRGGHAHPIMWDFAEGRDIASQRQRVVSQVELAVDELTAAAGAGPVVVGKSLGSLAAPLVADRGLAAVWFTPLLTDEPTVAALRRATGPCAGRLTESAAVLGQIITAVEDFLDQVVWP